MTKRVESCITIDIYVEQALAVGDGRSYVSALVVPSFPILEAWCREMGLANLSRPEHVRHPDVIAFYKERIEARCHSREQRPIPARIYALQSGKLWYNAQQERRVKMAIRVFIKRVCEDPGKEKELFGLIRKLRSLVPQQHGYLSSKYVKKIDPPKDIVAISTWDTLEDWQNWYDSEERREIQSRIDAIPGVKSTVQVYEDTKTE